MENRAPFVLRYFHPNFFAPVITEQKQQLLGLIERMGLDRISNQRCPSVVDTVHRHFNYFHDTLVIFAHCHLTVPYEKWNTFFSSFDAVLCHLDRTRHLIEHLQMREDRLLTRSRLPDGIRMQYALQLVERTVELIKKSMTLCFSFLSGSMNLETPVTVTFLSSSRSALLSWIERLKTIRVEGGAVSQVCINELEKLSRGNTNAVDIPMTKPFLRFLSDDHVMVIHRIFGQYDGEKTLSKMCYCGQRYSWLVCVNVPQSGEIKQDTSEPPLTTKMSPTTEMPPVRTSATVISSGEIDHRETEEREEGYEESSMMCLLLVVLDTIENEKDGHNLLHSLLSMPEYKNLTRVESWN